MKRILIFGTGDFAKCVINGYIGINEDNYEIIGYVDNNSKKQGLSFCGKKVFMPREINNIVYDNILICSMYYGEIRKQLVNEGGISEEK